MATTRYNDGNVTVTLDGGLEAFVRRALDAVAGETVRLMEKAAEDVADPARASWYDPSKGGVTKRTGETGDIDVVTTVSDTEVRVSVGSTDINKAKYVHRPGRLSTTTEEITKEVYEHEKNRSLAKLVFHARKDQPDAGIKAGKYYRIVHNELASDGMYLLPELIRKPMKAKIADILPELGRTIASKMGGG